MNMTPDQTIYWSWGPAVLNATLVWTWALMGLMVLAAWLVRRKLVAGPEPTRGQSVLETIVEGICSQIGDVAQQDAKPYLPFIGTLYLFIAVSNFLDFVPGYRAPTGSLSTTAALALCVFVAVPFFAIRERGFRAYLRQYVEPSWVMLPFQIVGEISRTLALAVRLFGNMMSGAVLGALALSFAPLFFPLATQALGLLIGQVQAYIFAVLATVYIASAARVQEGPAETPQETPSHE